MYETFEEIERRMLGRVSAKFDKREGAIIYDATAAAAVEFQNQNIERETLRNELFPDTASREYLIKHCAERRLTPYPASYATVAGKFTPANLEIPIGTRFSHEDFNYAVTEKIADGLYYLQCETIGSEPNGVTGQLIPIDYVNGLQTAEIIEVTFIGEDEEETEALRERYFASVKSESFGGNQACYMQKVRAISRVGQVKLYSAAEWNGNGTVKIVITDSDNKVPSSDLVEQVQLIIDPEMVTADGLLTDENEPPIGTGTGAGIAPIGHFVTIVGAYDTKVNINTVLTYKSGYSWAHVQSEVEAAIDRYLASLNANWEDLDKIRVRIAHIESAILDVDGILDIQGTTINGKAENLAVDKDSLVSRGAINGN